MSIDGTALAQSCVWTKTANKKGLRIGEFAFTQPLYHGQDVTQGHFLSKALAHLVIAVYITKHYNFQLNLKKS